MAEFLFVVCVKLGVIRFEYCAAMTGFVEDGPANIGENTVFFQLLKIYITKCEC